MKIVIFYDSKTGNTKKLADVIYEECHDLDVSIYDDYNDNVLSADLLFIGSWTFKGEPSDKIKLLYQGLSNKKIFIFGTCSTGGREAYFKFILENTKKYINNSNEILNYYFCPGKLPMSIKEKYEEMLKEKPNDKRILSMLINFNNVLDRPNEYDLEKLRKKVRDVLNESNS